TTMFLIMLVLCPLTVFGLLAIYPLFPAYFAAFRLWSRLAWAACCALSVAYFLYTPLLVAQLHVARNSIAEMSLGAGYTVAAGAMALSGRLTVQTAPVIPVIASATALLVVLAMVRNHFDFSFRPDWKLIRGLMKYGAKLLAGGLALNAHTQ